MSSMICIKTVCNGEVRRVSIAEAKLKVARLERLVKKQFPALLKDAPPLLQYHDDEDDKITIRVNDELEEAVRVAARLNKVLRLLVSKDISRNAAAAASSQRGGGASASVEESKADADDDWRAKALQEFKASFVADKTLADGSAVEAGAQLTKTWRIKNNGAKAWPEGMALVCVGGNMKPKEQRVALPAVVPGAEVDVSVELTAPEAGRGKSVWRFAQRDAQQPPQWGLTLWAYVVVNKDDNDAAGAAASAAPANDWQAKRQLWAKKAAMGKWAAAKKKKETKQKQQGVKVSFVADKTLPDGTEVGVGQTITKTWTVRNNGSVAWPEGAGLLCVKSDNMEVKQQRVALPPAAPGADVDVSVEVTLTQAGNAKGVWTFVDRDGKRIGHTRLWAHAVGVKAAAEPQEPCQFKVAFVADKTLADGTAVEAGATVIKTWTVRNNGESAWPATDLVCTDGNLAAEGTRVPVPSVAAGAEADVSVELQAPDEATRAKSVWRFVATKEQRPFGGDRLWADLQVVVPNEKKEEAAAPAAEQQPSFKVAFVADKTLADGSKVRAGEVLTKTWTIRNDGSEDWPHGGVMLVCVDGNMEAKEWKVLPTLAPNAEMDVSVEVTAPQDGRAKSVWAFQKAGGQRLSDVTLWVDVVAEPEPAAQPEPESKAEDAAVVVEAQPIAEAQADNEDDNNDDKPAEQASWASYAVGALAGGVVGVAHMISRGDAAPAEAEEAAEADGFKTAEDDDEELAAAVVVVPANTEAAVEMVEVSADDVVVLQNAQEVPAPPEEPSVAAAAAPPAPPSKWESQLTQLAEMGFADRDILTPLLEQHRGNVHRVVLQLLQQFQQ